MSTDYSDWSGQYLLTKEPAEVPGWMSHCVAGRYLAAHPTLPVVPIMVGGLQAGALMGWPVSPEGILASRLDLSAGSDVVEMAYQHGGRWLLITRDAVYLDAAGSQPAVYHVESGTVASSPGLIDAEDDAELVAVFDVVERDGWYPFGLTPKRGVKRLLPNHALDLDTFEARRYHAGPERGGVPTEAAARVVIEAVRSVAKAFERLECGLTAGRDSRLLLAALRPHLDRVRFRTGQGDANGNVVDVQVACKLARDHGFPHTLVRNPPAAESDLRGWYERVGWVRAGNRANSVTREETHAVTLNGAVGEVARAYYWKGDTRADGPLAPETACERLKAPALPVVLDAAAAWLRGLPFNDRLRTLDHLYLEQRVGCWASPGNLGTPATLPTLYPFTRRDAIDAMLGMSDEVKRDGALAEEGIRQAWPELLAVPFNEPLGLLALREWVRALTGKSRFYLGGLRRRMQSM